MPGTIEDVGVAVSKVIARCRDAELGYRSAADVARESGLHDLFKRYSEQHGHFAQELQETVKALGYDPTYPAGLGGMAYAGWVNLVALVSGHDQHALLTEAERGQDWIRKAYREAVDTNLPVGLRTIIEKQLAEVEKNCDYLRVRRDATDVPNRTA